MNNGLQHSIRQTQEQVAYLNQSNKSTEEELRQQTEEATELVEKQNALIVTLEAKVCHIETRTSTVSVCWWGGRCVVGQILFISITVAVYSSLLLCV
jgi:hypothetical protein